METIRSYLLRYRMYIAAIACFFLGIIFALVFILNNGTQNTPFSERHQSGYKFISPLLECNNSQEIGLLKYNELDRKVTDYIDEMTESNKSLVVSLYFRDMNNGPWISINANELFSPASLMKVPILIAYLRKSDEDPTFLHRVLPVTVAPTTVEQTIKPSEKLEADKNYSIEDLLYRMIAYSDNDATATLFADMPPDTIEQVYNELGIAIPSPTGHEDNVLSVRDYASFFRILFNSSYLSKAASEQALSLLTKSVFQEGLVAGVDKGVIVAHKFGEREFSTENYMQLHDCGIIYHPKKPYLLCVMTRGGSKDELSQTIAGISRIVFDTISAE